MSDIRILTAAQMRWADEQTISSGTSSFKLMDRAGRALAASILECMPDYGRVVIITGAGNNGGDGFAAGQYLRTRRLPVTIVSLVPLNTLTEPSKEHAEIARAAGVKIREACADHCLDELGRWLLRAVIVVDAMFGIGLNRPLDALMVEVVERINQTDRPVISVDIASGLCADTGAVLGAAVQADYTLPIAASKWGHWLAEGRDYTGKLLDVADIGMAESTIEQSWQDSCEIGNDGFCVNSTCLINDKFLASAWPERSRLTHKGSYGHVCVFGGSVGHTGAPQLAGLGAYAAGAGLASLICPDDVWPVIAAANLEVMCQPESAASWQQMDAIVAGPGWGIHQAECLQTLLASDKPLLIDADALNIIAADSALQDQLSKRYQQTGAITVMTPHPGEAARLLACSSDEIQANRKESVLALTTRYACWVVLKGSETLIASPQGDIYLNPFGSAQLAVAGSGDVLAGMIGAQLAKSVDSSDGLGVLISSAVALHGKAGERQGWYLAGELTKQVADVRQRIEQHGKA
ncbi:MAG: NAD(P)H-hydrate dehydratase [Mariprofundus sp.]|nr:NAD(P)H-hydrate dehydratase [Mariprofundus sp.]